MNHTVPLPANTFRDHPVLTELKQLHATESTLERRYVRLRQVKHPARAARVRFVAELAGLQRRLESLNQTLNATAQ